MNILKEHKEALGWTIADIKGISPSTCMHRILLEEGAKPSRQPQRRLNPPMMEVVKKEVLKLLQADMIFPISDSQWVSPTQVVPKKGGITVVENQQGELVPTSDSEGALTTEQEEEAFEVKSEGPITRARARAIARATQSLVAQETRDDAARKCIMLSKTLLCVAHEE